MMKTRLTILAAIMLVSVLSVTQLAFAGWVKPSGDVKKELRDVGSFNAIDVGGAFTVTLTQGETEKVEVEADDNLLPYIVTKVRGGELEIYLDKKVKDFSKLNVYIQCVDLEELDVSGASSLSSEGLLKFSSLGMEVNGAASVELELALEELVLEVSGAAHATLYGTAQRVDLELSGAASLKAAEFEVDEMDAEVTGAAKGKVNVITRLDAEVSGAAFLGVIGNPEIDSEVSGAATLKRY
ncbi:MAG: head GIN domain-containing protein [Bacteroidales bacterium]